MPTPVCTMYEASLDTLMEHSDDRFDELQERCYSDTELARAIESEWRARFAALSIGVKLPSTFTVHYSEPSQDPGGGVSQTSRVGTTQSCHVYRPPSLRTVSPAERSNGVRTASDWLPKFRRYLIPNGMTCPSAQ
ncbi:hypothetical protein BD311DRAFT_842319 [Dichomitus squalens]|uniref:Uncharacterized protein n=1 Tax=Dichomitus squalens TaxID=114155 RepID=A0A4Q9MJV7_9APHY|nr:hypothetical protein BD311DRAFT_842319 [Dichomitus squalens]